MIYELPRATWQHHYVDQTNRILKQIQEHIRYMQHNDPQSSCAFSTLNNALEYGTLNNFMSLTKQVNTGPLKKSFEQFCVQSQYYHNKLISEQNKRQRNTMYQLYLTFSYVTPAHDQFPNFLFLQAFHTAVT